METRNRRARGRIYTAPGAVPAAVGSPPDNSLARGMAPGPTRQRGSGDGDPRGGGWEAAFGRGRSGGDVRALSGAGQDNAGQYETCVRVAWVDRGRGWTAPASCLLRPNRPGFRRLAVGTFAQVQGAVPFRNQNVCASTMVLFEQQGNL
jgi:hypothetical protein